MPTLEQRINNALEALGFSPTTQVLPGGTVTHAHQADGTKALVTCVDVSMGATEIASIAHLLQRDVDSTNIELITILAMPGAEDRAIELEDAQHWSVPIDIHVLEAEATGRTHLNLEEEPAGTERLAQPFLSDQFIGKETHEIIDLLGEQLIDLSRRNPMLNFTLKKDTIRLIRETPNGLFKVLVNKNNSMQLEPDWDLKDEPTKRRGRAARSGTGSITASTSQKTVRDHTLDESSDGCAEHYDTDMQTAMSPNMLMRTAGKVFTEARRLINNTGTNQLYLAIGFLSWFEKPESDIESRAPLLLIPLVIEREKSIVSVPILPDDPDRKPDGGQNQTRRVEQFRYALTYTGDELRINVALRLRLADEFNLVLPDTIQNVVDGEMSPEAYLEQVAKMAASYTGDKRWRVRREACIGFFDFAQAWMYEDITSEAWKRTPCEGIDTIFSGGQGGRTGLPSLTPQQMEDSEAAYEIPLICPADTSQYQVITQALGNHSLVVEGPPGTGKSQTITNIISALMAQKKRVLFLAAKETALTVVAKRLEDAGLGDLLLTMHADGKSGGTSALEVVNSITQRMHHYDRIAPKLKPQPEIKRLEDRAIHARKNLNALVEQLARVDAVTGDSLSTLIWKANGALDAYERAAAEAGHPAVFLPTGDAIQRLGFNEATLESEDFVLYLRNLELDGVLNPVPEWRGIKAAHLAPEQISRLTDAAESFQAHMASVEESGLPCLDWSNTTPGQLLTWYDTLAIIAPNPMPQIGSDLPLEDEFDTVHGSITDFSTALSEYHEAFSSLDMPADRLPSEPDLTQALEGRSKLVENCPAWRDSGNQAELDDLRRQLESLNRNCAAMNEPDGALAAFPSDFVDAPTIANMSDWLVILQLLDGDEAPNWGHLTAAMGKKATSDLIDIPKPNRIARLSMRE